MLDQLGSKIVLLVDDYRDKTRRNDDKQIGQDKKKTYGIATVNKVFNRDSNLLIHRKCLSPSISLYLMS